jgi:hypothetical protein
MKKVVVPVLVVVAVVAAALLAWIKFNQGTEYSFAMPSAAKSSAPISLSAPAMSSSLRAMSATESVPAAVDAPPAQYATWRQEMKAGCAAGNPELKIEHFDVNGDDIADTICRRTIKTKDWGDFVDLEAIVKGKTGRVQTAYIILGVSATEQEAICGDVDKLSVKQGRWTKAKFDGMGWDYIGPVSIDIEGSECDPPWLFWPKNARGDEVEFDFERM